MSGYSVTLSRSIYGAKEREGELYNVDNLQTQNGYMFEPGDSVTLNIDDDGVVDMFSQLYRSFIPAGGGCGTHELERHDRKGK